MDIGTDMIGLWRWLISFIGIKDIQIRTRDMR